MILFSETDVQEKEYSTKDSDAVVTDKSSVLTKGDLCRRLATLPILQLGPIFFIYVISAQD